eukprot:TRINITY_DN18050_c0_g1_i1.p1 TRINITY_DN18050_c0_g1~~TRINITY_DN18050_c0_g1_i1.p1  ORF type:complete len:1286 (+),score=278.32 TRINITY_DN18050_c0_g1_i1:94-3951(+)
MAWTRLLALRVPMEILMLLAMFCGPSESARASSFSQLEVQHRDMETTTASKAQSCQYSTTPGGLTQGHPKKEGLIGVCPPESSHGKVCLAKNSGAKMTDTRRLGIADCEQLCNRNAFMTNGRTCLGYVVRKDFGRDVEKGRLQCWLIHSDAEMSTAYPDEVKFTDFTQKSRLTYMKEYCGCKVRLVNFQDGDQVVERKQLAIDRYQLKKRKTLLKTREQNASVDETKLKAEIANLQGKVDVSSAAQKKWDMMRKFEGVYDWVPLKIPHRIRKGAEGYLPGAFVKMFKSGFSGQSSGWKAYWDAPVRITKIFKKLDASAVLYRCMDKSKHKESWYFATQEDGLSWLNSKLSAKAKRATSEGDQDSPLDLGQLKEMQNTVFQDFEELIGLYFSLTCIGTELQDDGAVKYFHNGTEVRSEIDPQFLNPSEAESGCFPVEQKAEAEEERVIQEEIGSCPVVELTDTSTDDDKDISMWTLASSDANFLQRLQGAEKLLEHDRLAKAAFTAAQYASWLTGWIKKKNKNDKNVKALHEFTSDEFQGMKSRAQTLLKGLGKMFVSLEASSNTDDHYLKLVCATELLHHIFEVGGLLPKVSQNLAMRPDLVADDFVRNKLKETQNANPSKGKEETMAYMREQDPKISFPGHSDVRVLDILEYKKTLSAGSVGQVDLFTIRRDTDQELQAEFRKLLPENYGQDTLVVKTVFQAKKDEYMNDWNLLEQFFTHMKGRLDAKFQLIWAVLEPMKESIFDEFDLRKEADFTARGREMLKEFTTNIDEGRYMPNLEPHSLKLTTPAAIATSSPFILIQSLASGMPLKQHLEATSGQIERLVEWKQKIYTAVLMIYGHMVAKYGFFQSDPHNGNWFWEPGTSTVTLIDWGGVGQMSSETRCKIANMYSHMGALQSKWEQCEAVTVAGSGKYDLDGVYLESGVSIFDAGPGDVALFAGKTFEMSYLKASNTADAAKGQRLSYDGKKWLISEERPGNAELHSVLAELETSTSKMTDLSREGSKTWVAGKSKMQMTLEKKDPRTCDVISRGQAYATAAKNMGIKLKLTCEPDMLIFVPEQPLSGDAAADWKETGKLQLKCIQEDEDGQFVEWGLHNPVRLQIQPSSAKSRGSRVVVLPNSEQPFLVDDNSRQAPLAPIWVEEAFERAALPQLAKLSPVKKALVMSTAESALALSAALFDSDLVTAAKLGLQAQDALGVLGTDVPDEYVLLARCIVVFHGMIADVVKDSVMRMVPQAYWSWLAISNGARFFKSWEGPAKEYLAEAKTNGSTCPSSEWIALEPRMK